MAPIRYRKIALAGAAATATVTLFGCSEKSDKLCHNYTNSQETGCDNDEFCVFDPCSVDTAPLNATAAVCRGFGGEYKPAVSADGCYSVCADLSTEECGSYDNLCAVVDGECVDFDICAAANTELIEAVEPVAQSCSVAEPVPCLTYSDATECGDALGCKYDEDATECVEDEDACFVDPTSTEFETECVGQEGCAFTPAVEGQPERAVCTYNSSMPTFPNVSGCELDESGEDPVCVRSEIVNCDELDEQQCRAVGDACSWLLERPADCQKYNAFSCEFDNDECSVAFDDESFTADEATKQNICTQRETFCVDDVVSLNCTTAFTDNSPTGCASQDSCQWIDYFDCLFDRDAVEASQSLCESVGGVWEEENFACGTMDCPNPEEGITQEDCEANSYCEFDGDKEICVRKADATECFAIVDPTADTCVSDDGCELYQLDNCDLSEADLSDVCVTNDRKCLDTGSADTWDVNEVCYLRAPVDSDAIISEPFCFGTYTVSVRDYEQETDETPPVDDETPPVDDETPDENDDEPCTGANFDNIDDAQECFTCWQTELGAPTGWPQDPLELYKYNCRAFEACGGDITANFGIQRCEDLELPSLP